jgi:hypothetical protein
MSPALDGPRPGQSSAVHCELCNRLIGTMNAMLDEHPDVVVGSAVLAACAAFVGFTISVGGSREVAPCEIEFAAERFAARIHEYLDEQAKQLATPAH